MKIPPVDWADTCGECSATDPLRPTTQYSRGPVPMRARPQLLSTLATRLPPVGYTLRKATPINHRGHPDPRLHHHTSEPPPNPPVPSCDLIGSLRTTLLRQPTHQPRQPLTRTHPSRTLESSNLNDITTDYDEANGLFLYGVWSQRSLLVGYQLKGSVVRLYKLCRIVWERELEPGEETGRWEYHQRTY